MTRLKQRFNNFSEQALNALRESGGRITKSRSAVVGCLSKAEKPMSAQDIYDCVTSGRESISIDRVSVYRILDALNEKGLVHLVGSTGKYIACLHSDCEAGQHLILSCQGCNMVREIDLPAQLAADLHSYLMRSHGFRSGSHGMILEGECRVCRKE